MKREGGRDGGREGGKDGGLIMISFSCCLQPSLSTFEGDRPCACCSTEHRSHMLSPLLVLLVKCEKEERKDSGRDLLPLSLLLSLPLCS